MMKRVLIQDKLIELGIDPSSIALGDFDQIGRLTAERRRDPNDPNYRNFGAFYRSNYERGILIYYLIRQLNITSMLEIGFGRGYSTFCAAKAFVDAGIDGTIVTVDPAMNEEYLKALTNVFPRSWFERIQFLNGKSSEALSEIDSTKRFDFVYIDGDHSYEGTKTDWELIKDRYDKCVLFDDYHMPSKNDPGIQCRELIDEIDDPSKELLILDRRMFLDDRKLSNDEINYGQVLITKSGVGSSTNDW
jgi:hypothetical protein